MKYRMSEGLTNIGTPLKEAMERTPQPKEPEQEPVAIVNGAFANRIEWKCTPRSFPADGTLLYTSPPQRQPLTDDDITKVIEELPQGINGWMSDWDLYEFTRAIEAAHGIKE